MIDIIIEADAATERWRRRLRVGLGLLIILSPLPFGSNRPWSILTLELCALLLGSVAIWIACRSPHSWTRSQRWALIASATVLVVGLLQLVPIPLEFAGILSGPAARAHHDVGQVLPELASSRISVSLSPPDTLDAVLRWTAFMLIGLSAAVAVRSVGHLRQLAMFLVVSGAFQALYGATEYLSGHQHIFWYQKQYFFDEASGTFINRNHYAAYLAMILPIASASALASPWPKETSRLRTLVLGLARREGLRLAFSGLAVGIIWIGVIFSYSRGGLAVALAGAGFVVFATRGWRRRARTLAALLLIPTFALLLMEVRAPGERFVEEGLQGGTLGNRTVVWSATGRMAKDAAPAGTGLGTFAEAFPLYRPPTVRLYWDHAHNDWLEALAEGGPVTLMAILLITGLAIASPFVQHRAPDPVRPLWVASLAAGIFVVALHSMVDFPLRIPAIGLLAAVLVGVSCGDLSSVEVQQDSRVTRLRPTFRGKFSSPDVTP